MKRLPLLLTAAAALIILVIAFAGPFFRAERSASSPGLSGPTAQGYVFLDRNDNGVRDRGEPGLRGVRVSDQRSVTATDRKGRWVLPAHEEAVYFVIKPQGYMTRLSEDNLPRFYYLHKETEQLELQGPTVPRSGPLPASIDFPLTRQIEPDRFEVIVMGDPQPRDIEEVQFYTHDVLEELIGTPAAFVITLGDISFDNHTLYPAINRVSGAVGIPFYNTLGNHDANYDGRDTYEHYETWRTFFGPRYYSFDYGPVHFVILADVLFPEGGTSYITGLEETQLDWLEEDLSYVPADRLVVLTMHIPLGRASQIPDFGRLYELLRDRPHTLSFSAHTHTLTNGFLDEDDGWPGAEPHHHVNAGATCGRWWAGNRDETDIPHASCSDGTPNGYFVVTFDGTGYTTRFKAARRPADYQMQIQAPDEVARIRLADTPVLVNVFNGSPRSTVEMAVGEAGAWVEMRLAPQVDPLYSRVAREQSAQRGSRCSHIWEGRLPAGLAPGGHPIRIRTTDLHGQVFTSSRIIRVRENGSSR